jgi:bacterioferritin-associated ferredoxin
MDPDDHVCLCFHVSVRKVRAFMKNRDMKVASQLSECFGAGTGCGWCVEHLKALFEQHQRGETPELEVDAEAYREGRAEYRKSRTDDASEKAE